MTDEYSIKSTWKTTQAVPLTHESFLDLLFGRTPLIGMPRFISPDQSDQVLQHLLPRFTPYSHATGPPVEKVGLAQFEFQAQSQEDFSNRTGNGKESSPKFKFQFLWTEPCQKRNDI